jgi:integrase
MDDMTRRRWPYLQKEKTRHGKTWWSVRLNRQSPRVRLRAEFGTPEFEMEYFAAVRGEKPAKEAATRASSGTLEWLWLRYTQSSAWTQGLKPATRRQRENIMKHVLEKAGKAPLEEIDKSSIVDGREHRKETPSQANNYLAALNGLFSWAVEADFLKTNPCEGVKTIKRPRSRGFPEWSVEDETAFIKKWPIGTRQYLAYMVHACTGLRRGDAVRLGRQHFKKDGKIHIQAEKNGAILHIPIHPQLVEAIKACPPSGLTILETTRGKPWVKESYGNSFHEWANSAGVNKNSHGIRKLAATRVADAGASELEMMALFGWNDPSMARVYTRAANQKRLAEQAAAKVGNAGMVLSLFQDGEEGDNS